jgi:ubiquinone/menaquinone biosynthesis C-methylase UbiE
MIMAHLIKGILAMDQNEHERWNEEMARKYNPDAFITKSGPLIRWVEGLRLRMTLRALDARESDAVLDLGCGPGNLLPLIHARKIVGVDPSDSLLTQARTRTAGRAEVQLIKALAEKLPFANDVFDRIVCSEVLEHVREPERALAEMHRVAKPGAKVVITVPHEELINWTKGWVLRLGLKKWVAGDYPMSDNMMEEWHVSEMTPEKIFSCVGNKMDLIKTAHVPFPFFAYHRIFVLSVTK